MSQPTASPRGPGLRIASVGGVPVYIGGSWLILAALIIVISASNLQGLGTGAYVVGVAFALSLLVAVLLHEGAHAVAARALGLPVHRVVANLWGGHTAYDGSLMSPAKMAIIAIVGPVTNLLLGLGALLLAASTTGVVGLVVYGVAVTNLFLGAFNLLPGLPLDGGQIVDAVVWKVSGNRSTGLIAAGWCGRAVALGVVVWAVLLPLMGGAPRPMTSVVWSVLIAGFMWSGATGAIRSGQARKVLSRSTLGQITLPARAWPSGTPLRVALEGGSTALVQFGEDWAMVGVPEHTRPEEVPTSAVVDSYATRLPRGSVIEAAPHEDLTQAVLAVQSTGWSVIVLTRAGQPYGVITLADLNAALEASNPRSSAN